MEDSRDVGGYLIGDYFRGPRQHWRSVLVGLTVGLVAALAILLWAPREYRAETSVLVAPTAAAPVVNLDTEAQLVTSKDTVAAAAERLDAPQDEQPALADRVRVSAVPNGQILIIAFSERSPEGARMGASAFAEAYLDQRRAAARAVLAEADDVTLARIDEVNAQLEAFLRERRSLTAGVERIENTARINVLDAQLASLNAQLDAVRASTVSPGQVVTEAARPASPSRPDRSMTLTAGLALGLLAGLGIAMARYRSDDRVTGADQLSESTGLLVTTVLAEPMDPLSVSIVSPTSANGHTYARLRNLVVSALRQSARPVIMVSAVGRGGGAVAVNLAAAVARAGEDVVLLCADLISPTPAALLGGAVGPGFVEVVEGGVDIRRAARPVPGISNLRVLGPGHDHDRAAAVLRSREMPRLVDDLLGSATYVVIEGPSTEDTPEAETLAHVAGAVLLVTEVGRTRVRDIRRACHQFALMGAAVLGATLTRHDGTHRGAGRHRAGSATPFVRGGSAVGSEELHERRPGDRSYAAVATPSTEQHLADPLPESQDGAR